MHAPQFLTSTVSQSDYIVLGLVMQIIRNNPAKRSPRNINYYELPVYFSFCQTGHGTVSAFILTVSSVVRFGALVYQRVIGTAWTVKQAPT